MPKRQRYEYHEDSYKPTSEEFGRILRLKKFTRQIKNKPKIEGKKPTIKEVKTFYYEENKRYEVVDWTNRMVRVFENRSLTKAKMKRYLIERMIVEAPSKTEALRIFKSEILPKMTQVLKMQIARKGITIQEI